MNAIDRYRRLQVYETEANRRALDSLLTVPDEQRSSRGYARAVQLLPHVHLARRVWLARLVPRPYEMPADWFPSWSLDETRAYAADADRDWSVYLTALTDATLAREVRYTSSEGQSFASLVEDVLIHVYNHSTYHRGQVARLVSECGGKRAVTDFIALTRRPV